ncbi:MAG TPA: isoprenylcysteine carboxylmethyltransferase family protein [Verrucomicrobiae bacterium]|nr:isoprenylcysteine carboxylmethyltransferase family protein [Verrucomicrobiae bacterium]
MQGARLYVFTAVQLVGVGVLVWLLMTWPTPWNAQRYMGTLLVVFGLTFIAIARYQLGTSFSVKPEAHALVTRGIYSRIRNPIYVFGTVMLAGLLLVIQRPVYWIVLAALVVVQTIRAHREAQVLEAAFGDAYREYRRKTWF